MHTDRTAVTIQSHQIVLNEVKDHEVLLQPPYGKKQRLFGQPSTFVCDYEPHLLTQSCCLLYMPGAGVTREELCPAPTLASAGCQQPGHCPAGRCITPVPATVTTAAPSPGLPTSLSLYSPTSYKEARHWNGAHCDPEWLQLRSVMLAKILFPKEMAFTGSGGALNFGETCQPRIKL